jgi:hypothetical protein
MRGATSLQALLQVVGEFDKYGGASVGLIGGSYPSMSRWSLTPGSRQRPGD